MNELNTKDDETEPEFHFPGVYLPPKIFHMLTEGELSGKDLALLAIIRALTKYGKKKMEEGCWATNAYFAKFLNVTQIRISQIISKLKELGLLKVYEAKKGMQPNWRFLYVVWDEEGLKENFNGGNNKVLMTYNNKVLTNINTIKENKEIKVKGEDAMHLPNNGQLFSQLTNSNGEKSNRKSKIPPPILDLADQLKRSFCKKMKCKVAIFEKYQMAGGLKSVVENFGETRVTKAIDYYCSNEIINEKNGNKLIIKSSKQLASCIGWIEDCMRSKNGESNDKNHNEEVKESSVIVKNLDGSFTVHIGAEK